MRALKKEEDETSKMYGPYGGVAQLGEHLLCKQGVIGSIPFISTISMKMLNKRAHSSGG